METQLSLDLRRRTWGGARTNAGRTRARKHDPAHRKRPVQIARHPVHVVLRTRPEIARLRKGRIFRALHQPLLVIAVREPFRVVHLSIQHNHLHLLVEAEHKLALSRGMQAFAIAAAKAINRALGRSGKVFAFRYHATTLDNPRQTRNALAYVLNNWRRHKAPVLRRRRNEDRGGERQRAALVDPYSSGVLFDGWTRGAFRVPEGYVPLPVTAARTWLLREGWKLHGTISPTKTPGPIV